MEHSAETKKRRIFASLYEAFRRANDAVFYTDAAGVILEVNSPPGYFWHHKRRNPGVFITTLVLGQLLQDQSARCAGPWTAALEAPAISHRDVGASKLEAAGYASPA